MKRSQVIMLTLLGCVIPVTVSAQRERNTREERPAPTPTPRSVARPQPPQTPQTPSGTRITNQPLPNGRYKITGRQSGKLLDISLTDSARLTIHGPAPNNGVRGANQVFDLQYDPSFDAYKIITYNGQCLDAAGETPYNNRLIHQYDCKSNNLSNQRFRLRHIEDVWWQIMVVQGTERCIDVINCSVGDKSWANEWECKRPGGDPNNCSFRIDNQLWRFDPPDPTPPNQDPNPNPDPSQPNEPSLKRICANAAVPSGWIIVDKLRLISTCGAPASPTPAIPNVWELKRYDDLPVGRMLRVCLGQNVPVGWRDVGRDLSTTTCGWGEGSGSQYNIMVIRRVD